MKKILFCSLVAYISLSATQPSTSLRKTSEILPFFQNDIPITMGTKSNPIGFSLIGGIRDDTFKITSADGTLGSVLELFTRPLGSSSQAYPALFDSTTQEWQFSQGKIYTQSKSIGAKIDAWIFPFMQVFFSGAYLNITQRANLGDASIPITQNLTTDHFSYYSGVLKAFGVSLSSTNATFHIGEVQTNLEGWFAMGGANFIYDYKGFFISCLVAGGYVTLNDTTHGITNYLQRPFMYIAPKIGYSFGKIFDTYLGVQRIQTFGENAQSILNTTTNGLAQSYKAQTSRFPIDFIIGTSLAPIKDFSLVFEYIVSPDSRGLNAEISYRF